MLGKPTGWANQSNELAWANRAKPCKSYSSSVYIDIGTGRIAFLWRNTVRNELFLQAVYEYTPWKNSTFVAQNRTNVPLGFGVLGKPNGLGGPVSSPSGLGRTSIKPKRVGRTRFPRIETRLSKSFTLLESIGPQTPCAGTYP